MAYPQPPWTLHGYGLQTVHLLDVDRVRSFIPAPLEVISVLPGKTVGGVYVANYQAGSTLTYSELIVVSGLVRQGRQIGGWISHIYVDSPDSVDGGRAIWGLPKELAKFEWQTDDSLSVRVTQAETLLCTLSSQWQLPGWYQSLSSPVFSLRNTELMQFVGDWQLKFHLAGINLSIPSSSPFADLNLDRPLGSFRFNPLHLIANRPIPVIEQDREKINAH